MNLGRPNRAPSFAWQAALILLPVAVLAVIGFLSLRQDRLLVRQEATERAKAIAESLAPELWQRFVASPQPGYDLEVMGSHVPLEITFDTNDRGELLSPIPYLPVPEPPPEFNPRELNPAQQKLWAETRRQMEAGDISEAARSAHQLVDTEPPERFAGSLCYELGVRLSEAGDTNAAREMFQALIDRFPRALGDTGLPLQPLARLKLFQLEPPATRSERPSAESETIVSLCRSLLDNPSSITSLILSNLTTQIRTAALQKEVRRSLALWQLQESARKVYAAARPRLTLSLSNTVFWVTVPAGTATASDVNWLVLLQSSSAGTNRFACRPESYLGGIVKAAAERPGVVPDYLGVGAEVAGRRVAYTAPYLGVWREENWMGRRGGGVKRAYIEGAVPELLASASDTAGSLRVSVYLTSPTVMLKRQQARAFWFKLLIGVSIASALVGLAAAHRAFDRQLRLNAAKTNFVSSVSHELRAPIASVRLMTESLEQGRIRDPQRQKEYYRLMHQECRRLSSLVENVLDLSRIEQGRKQYEFEPTDLVALVRATVELMRPQAAEAGVTLETRLGQVGENSTFAPVVDGKAIQQALVNLLDNAIKHSNQGQRVTVGLELGEQRDAASEETQDGFQCILLWVEDQGEGIPPEDHERIFEQFYRRGSELRRETQGVGIGLSIVKHIVEAHTGRVLVRSAVGQGSRFTIELPIPASAAQSKPQAYSATSK